MKKKIFCIRHCSNFEYGYKACKFNIDGYSVLKDILWYTFTLKIDGGVKTIGAPEAHQLCPYKRKLISYEEWLK